jgi:hypothetical protein
VYEPCCGCKRFFKLAPGSVMRVRDGKQYVFQVDWDAQFEPKPSHRKDWGGNPVHYLCKECQARIEHDDYSCPHHGCGGGHYEPCAGTCRRLICCHCSGNYDSHEETCLCFECAAVKDSKDRRRNERRLVRRMLRLLRDDEVETLGDLKDQLFSNDNSDFSDWEKSRATYIGLQNIIVLLPYILNDNEEFAFIEKIQSFK